MYRLLVPAVLLLALAGCSHAPPPVAAAGSSPLQSVRVDTPGVTGAACVVQTAAGTSVVLSPARLDVPRNAQALAVTCSKGEHFRGAQTVASRRVVENGDSVYSYPASVSVPMTLYNPSLKPEYRVF